MQPIVFQMGLLDILPLFFHGQSSELMNAQNNSAIKRLRVQNAISLLHSFWIILCRDSDTWQADS